MDGIGKVDRAKTAFLLVDIQERFMPVIHRMDMVVENANRIVRASSILDIPLLVTEQYPKGLGKTVDAVGLPPDAPKIEKTEFSCFGNEGFVRRLKALDADTLAIFGIEAHVCVLKTVLDALQEGYNVHVIADAVSSRTQENRETAMERMRQAGAFIASTEMILFQLMDRAGTDEFREISRLVK